MELIKIGEVHFPGKLVLNFKKMAYYEYFDFPSTEKYELSVLVDTVERLIFYE